ncbi:MAG: hypothetical protein KTR32_24735 [Granulosicoccus sp.]|nr:hypothetical protein [Granulosicoccus sp.]
MIEQLPVATLWWAVVVSGLYHGINPGMGWPLAVSAGLMKTQTYALPKALLALTIGHFIAMTAILLPFSLMTSLVIWEKEIRIGAGILVVATGVYLLVNQRHPRFLARVHPAKLALWSFLAAMAHGAGLMLVPIYLGICASGDLDAGHQAAGKLMGNNVQTALIVAVVHTVAMTAAGGLMATIIYFWLGLKFLSKTWFNLDLVWALSLILVGVFGISTAM